MGTMEMVTRRHSWGVEWASDQDVIKAHFRLRRTEEALDDDGVGKQLEILDDDPHHPAVLSMWHEQVQKDKIARLAAKIDREQGFQPRKAKEAWKLLKRATPDMLARRGTMRPTRPGSAGPMSSMLSYRQLSAAVQAEALALGGAVRSAALRAAMQSAEGTGADSAIGALLHQQRALEAEQQAHAHAHARASRRPHEQPPRWAAADADAELLLQPPSTPTSRCRADGGTAPQDQLLLYEGAAAGHAAAQAGEWRHDGALADSLADSPTRAMMAAYFARQREERQWPSAGHGAADPHRVLSQGEFAITDVEAYRAAIQVAANFRSGLRGPLGRRLTYNAAAAAARRGIRSTSVAALEPAAACGAQARRAYHAAISQAANACGQLAYAEAVQAQSGQGALAGKRHRAESGSGADGEGKGAGEGERKGEV